MLQGKILRYSGYLSGTAGVVLLLYGTAELLGDWRPAAAVGLVFGVLLLLWAVRKIRITRPLLYLLTTVLMLSGPVLGTDTPAAAVFLVLYFQAVFLTESLPGRRALPQISRWAAALTAGLCALALILGLTAEPLLYQSVYAAEGFFNRSIRRSLGLTGEEAAHGRISRGNNYRTGAEQLRIRTTVEPEETLYLKGFTGGDYEGNNWGPDLDEEIFDAIAEKRDWPGWQSWIASIHRGSVFLLNSNRETPLVPALLTVRQNNYGDGIYYSPYNGRWQDYDPDYQGYRYQFFQQKQLEEAGEAELKTDMNEFADWIHTIETSYDAEAREVYTEVPRDRVPQLVSLCQEHSWDSLEEITAFILETLHERTTYTLTPGLAPLNQDIVEYFLFGSGEGYCVHYASAATLMYRMYGVPARYAAGYAIPAEDFEQGEDGAWYATATDENAHAWVEIYQEETGWLPVEVTSAVSAGGTYAGMDGSSLMDLAARIQESTAGQEETQETPEEEERAGEDAQTVWQAADFEIPSWLPWTAEVLLLAALAGWIFWRRWRRGNVKKDCRYYFGEFLRLVQRHHLLEGMTGAEEDFVKQAEEALPWLEPERIQNMTDTVSQASFGRRPVTKEEEEQVYRVYRDTEAYFYSHMRWIQKCKYVMMKEIW